MTAVDTRPQTRGHGDHVEFRVRPNAYKHWKVNVDGPVATVTMDIDEAGGIREGYELKLNSYDLVQRLRFEHPQVGSVVVTSGKEKIFCAGANIRMLAGSEHGWKVNFCKFTNETRNGIEDAAANSGQRWIAALNGTASGGGYELALACDHIMLIDDRSSAVSLPELPLLGVLPGTGGLTRVVDKRFVRRDVADYFATRTEGVGGRRAVSWKLVDEVVPRAKWDEVVKRRATELGSHDADRSKRKGIFLAPLEKTRSESEISYDNVTARLDRQSRTAEITISGPTTPAPASVEQVHEQGIDFWSLAVVRELDDLILDLRTNEPGLGTWVFRTEGDAGAVVEYDKLLLDNLDDWLANEIVLYLKRTLKRLDVTSRSLLALIEPGSCWAGSLLEIALASDRSYQLLGESEDFPGLSPATITVTAMNLWPLPMGNGLCRLETRFLHDREAVKEVKDRLDTPLEAEEAESLGLVTFAPDDIDWPDEIRMAVEERGSFSPDALTGLEANCRFAGPETMETKIFARLTAWQNWIFNRPNASGPEGALRRYGTGKRADYDMNRV